MEPEDGGQNGEKPRTPEITETTADTEVDGSKKQISDDQQAEAADTSGIPWKPTLESHLSVDSGIVPDELASSAQPNAATGGQQQEPLIEPQLAEEQELVPDVRRIPKRHRRRRRSSVIHKYVFDRRSTATQLSEATRA